MDMAKGESSRVSKVGEMNNNGSQRPVSNDSESQSKDQSLLDYNIDGQTPPPLHLHPAFHNEELESANSRLVQARQNLVSGELELAREEAKRVDQRLTKISQVLREHDRALKERENKVADRESWVSHRERQIRIREQNARERETQIQNREQQVALNSSTTASEVGKRSLSFRTASPTQMTLKDFWQRSTTNTSDHGDKEITSKKPVLPKIKTSNSEVELSSTAQTNISDHGDKETTGKKPVLPKIKTSNSEVELPSTAQTSSAITSSSENSLPRLSRDSHQRRYPRYPILTRLSPLTPQTPSPPPFISKSAAASPVEAAATAPPSFWKKAQHKAAKRLANIFVPHRNKGKATITIKSGRKRR